MNQIKEELSHLIALTEMHLLQEYGKGQWVFAEREIYASLKSFAAKKASSKPAFSPLTPPKEPYYPPTTPLVPKHFSEKKKKEEEKLCDKAKEEKSCEIKSHTFELHSLLPPKEESFDDLKKVFSKVAPAQTICSFTPQGEEIKEGFLPKALILYDEETAPYLPFLRNLSKAIHLCLCPSLCLSTSDKKLATILKSDQTKMIVGLKSCFKNPLIENTGVCQLELPSIEAYYKSPEKKASLWDEICKTLG